jgi:ribulose-5-phosphate 4-epimerase/fuculose-1-phosphate aldolase
MAVSAKIPRIDPQEAVLRRDLAACYRMVAHYGWDDLVATHISVRLPGGAFLLNPFGMLFEEIRPSDLVKVDMEGNILEPTEYQVNAAGFCIHSAIHAAREDAHCVMHLHTHDGVAVSMMEEGLLPLNQTAMIVARDIAFHEFEGIATNLDERERLAADLGDKNLMILRNHGTLATGRTPAECFALMYLLEWSCTTQVRALATGRPIHHAQPDVVDKVAATLSQSRAGMSEMADKILWPAILRKLDRMDPTWRN